AARDLAIGIEDGTVVAPSDFDITWTTGSHAGGTLTAAAIELEPLARLAASLPLPERVRGLLAEVKPRGRLAEARVEWRGEPPAPAGFAAGAPFGDPAPRAGRGAARVAAA